MLINTLVLIVASICTLYQTDTIEPFLGGIFTPALVIELALGGIYIPYGLKLADENEKPEYWETSRNDGFDEVYSKMEHLLDYESAAFEEAGWQVNKDYNAYNGPNFNAMMILLMLVTLVCFSVIALLLLV